ncbi:hypothetical protein TNCV_4696591 [Trichonephila clavipes]|nr:hypothetical protein TNCV_4696591 [Trichonephila clavipes]
MGQGRGKKRRMSSLFLCYRLVLTFAQSIMSPQDRTLLNLPIRLEEFPDILFFLLFTEHADKQPPVFWNEMGEFSKSCLFTLKWEGGRVEVVGRRERERES